MAKAKDAVSVETSGVGLPLTSVARFIGRQWPSLNDLLVMHPRTRSRHVDYYARTAQATAAAERWWIPAFLDAVHTEIWLIRVGYNWLDHDNLVGGAKVVIDALKAEVIKVGGKPVMMPMQYKDYPERTWGLYADDRKECATFHISQHCYHDKTRHGTYVNWRFLRR